MSPNTVRRLASVIVPCWNQLEFTRQCVAALMRQTGANWELIVVNNGSTDPTGDYLAGVQDAASVPVTLINNATNRGFPAAVNQGLHHARGEYLVLLNNDVVVTDGWLDQLIGLVSMPGPKSETGVDDLGAVESPRDPPQDEGESITVGKVDSASQDGPEETEGGSERRRPKITVIDFKKLKAEKDRAARRSRQGREHRIGLVGPMSNYATPPQLVPDVGYQRLDEMPAFARRWRDEHRGRWFIVPKLSGFCLLMKRAVHDAIGGLDERFGLGMLDDDDFSERARRAGFDLAVAKDLFVHHFGSRTIMGNMVDGSKLLEENAAKFAAKWGDSVPRGRRVALRPFGAHPQIHQQRANDPQMSPGNAETNRSASAGTSAAGGPGVRYSPADRARVSLTIIARDEQENLPCCLESVRGLFDEIVVVDTGSKDRTIEIARSFGARVFDFVWVDDFAAARNAALARATGDYAFWLDADDLIEPPERKKLEELLGSLTGGTETPAYVVRCACDPGPDGGGGATVVDHIRLFPVFEGVRWTYRVHEQILPALKRAGVPTEWTDITIRHTGYADPALRSRKLDRDARILLEELAERPDDPFTLFNLGAIAVERGQWNEALGYLKRSLAGSAPTDSITRKLFALIARSHQMLGDLPAALNCCAEGLSLDSEDAELWFRKAVVHRHGGELAEAEQCWRRILTLSRPQKFASMDKGIYGHLTRRNLAALAKQRGDLKEAARQWRAVLAECPGDSEALKHVS
jgi:glycosyltransferase involved in cell wall biosynthesis